MHKLVAIYRTPADAATFEDHYFSTHKPLMEQLPGYDKIEVSRLTRKMMGQDDVYLMFEMWFSDKEAMKAALKSPENINAGQDLMGFAADLVTVFTAEVI